jgi:hypothetical protein
MISATTIIMMARHARVSRGAALSIADWASVALAFGVIVFAVIVLVMVVRIESEK